MSTSSRVRLPEIVVLQMNPLRFRKVRNSYDHFKFFKLTTYDVLFLQISNNTETLELNIQKISKDWFFDLWIKMSCWRHQHSQLPRTIRPGGCMNTWRPTKHPETWRQLQRELYDLVTCSLFLTSKNWVGGNSNCFLFSSLNMGNDPF